MNLTAYAAMWASGGLLVSAIFAAFGAAPKPVVSDRDGWLHRLTQGSAAQY